MKHRVGESGAKQQRVRVCVHVRMSLPSLWACVCARVCACASVCRQCACACVRACVCMCVCLCRQCACACVCARVCTCAYVSAVSVRVRVRVRVRLFCRQYACACAFACAFAFVYVCAWDPVGGQFSYLTWFCFTVRCQQCECDSTPGHACVQH